MADINRFGGLNECVAVVDSQFCSFQLKFSHEMFSHLITSRVVEVSISPPIRSQVSVCHYIVEIPARHGKLQAIRVSKWQRTVIVAVDQVDSSAPTGALQQRGIAPAEGDHSARQIRLHFHRFEHHHARPARIAPARWRPL